MRAEPKRCFEKKSFMDLLYPLRRKVVAAEEAAGAAEPGHDGAEGDLELIGDFLVSEFVEVGELEDLAVWNGQLGKGAGKVDIGRGGRGSEGFQVFVGGPATAMVAGAMKQDAKEPGAEVGSEFEAGELAPGDEEGVLEDLLSGLSTTEHTDGGPEQGGLMAEGFGGEVMREARGVHSKKFVVAGNKVTLRSDIESWEFIT